MLRNRLIRLAASMPKGADRKALVNVLASTKTAGDDPSDSDDPRIRKLYEEVGEFLYPEWYEGIAGRGDLEFGERDLMEFYQGFLNEGDWVAIPKLLAAAQQRSDREYAKNKKKAQDAMSRSPDRFMTQKELNRLLGSGWLLVMMRMSHEGLVQYMPYQGGGWELTSRR